MMTKYDLEPIVKTYYDALEEGDILGRKCTRCGHIEFPPYLCCNSCGCLDTKWVNLNHVRGVVKQALPTVGAFGDQEGHCFHVVAQTGVAQRSVANLIDHLQLR